MVKCIYKFAYMIESLPLVSDNTVNSFEPMIDYENPTNSHH